MSECQFCHMADDGTVACWNMEGATIECDVTAAEIYIDDGITVILRTPKLENDQRLHVDTLYCPMCGRKYNAEVL